MVKTGLDTELIVGLGSVLKVALPYLGCLSAKIQGMLHSPG